MKPGLIIRLHGVWYLGPYFPIINPFSYNSGKRGREISKAENIFTICHRVDLRIDFFTVSKLKKILHQDPQMHIQVNQWTPKVKKGMSNTMHSLNLSIAAYYKSPTTS